ncbi:MAG: LamG domain-containing protein [Victivallaceae bacterium]|nr:LamG domain-containing protein [Victivallaceae bacterium]
MFDHGKKHNDALIHGAKWVKTNLGIALEFDGLDDYADCGNIKDLDDLDAFTISMWIKPYKNKIGNMRILAKGDKSSGIPDGYRFSIYLNNDVLHFVVSNGVKKTTVKAPVKINNFQQIIASYDGSKVKLYIDGKLQEQKPLTGKIPYSPKGLYIGSLGAACFYKGLIKDVRIYNCSLEAKEIQEKNRIAVLPKIICRLAKEIDNLQTKIDTIRDKSLLLKLVNRETNKLRDIVKKAKLGKYNLTVEDAKKIADIDFSLMSLNKLLTALENKNIPPDGPLVYIVNPITNEKIHPDDFYGFKGEISNDICALGCEGEYKPFSFVFFATEDTDLKLKASPLRGKVDMIPAANVDIKVVKWWYQAGEGGNTPVRRGKFFIPELLLHDDSLVKTDKQGDNYLKLRFPEGEKYVCISKEEGIRGISGHPANTEFPVMDSPDLQPVHIGKNSNKQFWITLKIPSAIKPGYYTGDIQFIAGSEKIGKINLRLKILPFELMPLPYTASIYYRGKLTHTDSGYISSEKKSQEQLKAELKNIYEHGLTNIPVYQKELDLLRKYLEIRKAAGFKDKSLYYLGFSTQAKSAKDILALKDKTREIIDIAKYNGLDTTYIYGIDEAQGKILTDQRPAWNAVHAEGGKIWVAGYSGKNKNFDLMGDIQDVLVCAGPLSKQEASKWHSRNHKIFSYANPQGGIEEPATYRKNYGISIWQNDYDGFITYAYQNGTVGALSWNDFEKKGNARCRHHNMTYPTTNGVVDTIQWEGYREAISDLRYLATLCKTIEEVKKNSSEKEKQAINEAEKYLAALKRQDIRKDSLDMIRLEIVNLIIKLKGL